MAATTGALRNGSLAPGNRDYAKHFELMRSKAGDISLVAGAIIPNGFEAA